MSSGIRTRKCLNSNKPKNKGGTCFATAKSRQGPFRLWIALQTKEADMNHRKHYEDYRKAWGNFKGLLALNLFLLKVLVVFAQLVLVTR